MSQNYNVLQNFIESSVSSKKDVLLFGDSVYLLVANEDNDKTPLDLMIQKQLPQLSMVVVKKTAYAADIFLEFINLYKSAKLALFKPSTICIHINLRCFSPQWKYYPLWQHRQEKKMLKKIYMGGDIGKYELRYFNFTFFHNWLYESRKVDYNASQYKRIREFIKIINSCPVDSAQKLKRFRTLFRFHYLYQLSELDSRLTDLKSCVDVSSEICQKVLLYSTPINYQAGIELFGDSFRQNVSEKINKISKFIKQNEQNRKVLFCDFSMLLDRDCFFHSYDSTEHLNEKGRNILASHIAERIKL
jgi:hypothetical protein